MFRAQSPVPRRTTSIRYTCPELLPQTAEEEEGMRKERERGKRRREKGERKKGKTKSKEEEREEGKEEREGVIWRKGRRE